MFVWALLKHATPGTWMSLRAFYEKGAGRFRIMPIQLTGDPNGARRSWQRTPTRKLCSARQPFGQVNFLRAPTVAECRNRRCSFGSTTPVSGLVHMPPLATTAVAGPSNASSLARAARACASHSTLSAVDLVDHAALSVKAAGAQQGRA
jgi:hypothetical protein